MNMQAQEWFNSYNKRRYSRPYRSVLVNFEKSADYVLVRTTPAAARKHYFTNGDGK